MNDQIHVRNAEAAHLARTLAKQTGKTINDVVLEALRQYRRPKAERKPARKLSEWRALLASDRKRRKARETPIESLYDEMTGLPE